MSTVDSWCSNRAVELYLNMYGLNLGRVLALHSEVHHGFSLCQGVTAYYSFLFMGICSQLSIVMLQKWHNFSFNFRDTLSFSLFPGGQPRARRFSASFSPIHNTGVSISLEIYRVNPHFMSILYFYYHISQYVQTKSTMVTCNTILLHLIALRRCGSWHYFFCLYTTFFVHSLFFALLYTYTACKSWH
jgi:hypothetical protein